MKNKLFRDFLREGLNKIGLAGLIQLYVESGLKKDGWFKSYQKKESIDFQGEPIPWFTYPFMKFIGPRLKDDFNLFEYGSGNSTLWFAQKVNSVVAVEHSKEWFDRIKNKVPSNVEIILRDENSPSSYANVVSEQNKSFHIIVIDGIFRNECVQVSVDNLTDDGIIIFDNSDRSEYLTAFNILNKLAFKRLDFWGMGPISSIETSTSIFYKNNNCLNI